ncbi:REP element-mobilizing transposase RayT [Formivibrio citricus]|uniref:REP element-mobilizing transposase RayT n=1 Tax=Formivibrio citricus TaxID=83765 RepID=A0A1I4VZZ4_9NEIS|nr:transposase [Formivibrio citricus]SFN06763.1 REP element-mobilizing transposase RayT [Formivibrio citricus]
MKPQVSTKARSADLRKGRVSLCGQTYLLTTATWQRQAFFRDTLLGRSVVHELRQAQRDGLVETLAFVVMPDHFHWLLTLRQGSLSALMMRVKRRSALAINSALKRQGPVWQNGFHDHALRKEEDLAAIARYIVANPLRAGLVAGVGEYPLWDAVWL